LSLAQAEADALLRMPKAFVRVEPLEFRRTEPMNSTSVLRSHDRREEFLFDLERGRRNRAHLKYQTRARKILVLARLELEGPRHRNPLGQPYRPGEWLSGNHLHLYREGFDDRIAYLLQEVDGRTISGRDGVTALEGFLTFCGVDPLPLIQTAL
jgi:hypothetical protein